MFCGLNSFFLTEVPLIYNNHQFLVYSKVIQLYIYIFHILFHYGLLQDIEYSSLCYIYNRTLFIYFVYNSL